VAYVVSADPLRIDRDWVWAMLSTEAYWLRWRTRGDVETQIDRAWKLVGAYDADSGAQVGFARALSDGVGDAFLSDVIVDPGHRGRGIGKLLMTAMVVDGPGAELRWVLFTDDAHGLYAQFGFTAPDHRTMVRPSPRAATS
jgi:GNAT superfamily N-acetyltransferase